MNIKDLKKIIETQERIKKILLEFNGKKKEVKFRTINLPNLYSKKLPSSWLESTVKKLKYSDQVFEAQYLQKSAIIAYDDTDSMIKE